MGQIHFAILRFSVTGTCEPVDHPCRRLLPKPGFAGISKLCKVLNLKKRNMRQCTIAQCQCTMHNAQCISCETDQDILYPGSLSSRPRRRKRQANHVKQASPGCICLNIPVITFVIFFKIIIIIVKMRVPPPCCKPPPSTPLYQVLMG